MSIWSKLSSWLDAIRGNQKTQQYRPRPMASKTVERKTSLDPIPKMEKAEPTSREEQTVKAILETIGDDNEDLVRRVLGNKPSRPGTPSLREKFFAATTVEELLEIRKKVQLESELERQVNQKIDDLLRRELEQSSSIDECLDVYEKSPPKSAIEKLAAEKILSLIQDENDCQEVIDESPSNSWLETQAKQKKKKLLLEKIRTATNIDDLMEIDLKGFTDDPEINQQFNAQVLALTKTTKDCLSICEDHDLSDELKLQLLTKALELTVGEDECVEIFQNTDDDSLQEKAAMRAITIAETVEDRLSAIEEMSMDEDLKEKLLQAILATAETPEDCHRVFLAATSDSEIEKQAIKKATGLVNSFSECEKIFDDQLHWDEVLERLLELATNEDEYLVVIEQAEGEYGNDEIAQKAYEKLLTVVNNFEKCQKYYYNCPDELKPWFLEKALTLVAIIEDCNWVHEESESDSDLEKLAGDKLDAMILGELPTANSFDECLDLFETTLTDGPAEWPTFEKALALTTTVKQCARLYQVATNYYEDHQEMAHRCIRKMAEIIRMQGFRN